MSHFETLQQAMSPVFTVADDALCPCRRPPGSEGADLCPEGRSEIQSKDRLQGMVDTCSQREIYSSLQCGSMSLYGSDKLTHDQ